MRTLVVADLHLGARTGADVLREAHAREALLGALEGVDRLVLLGDTLELRHGPPQEALALADPLLRAIAERLAPGARVVLTAGNHDHAIVAPWLEAASAAEGLPLGLDDRADGDATPLGARLQAALGDVPLELRYPGVWLRQDVYATHGHYLDCHVSVPTFERLAIAVMLARVVAAVPERAAPADYEAALAPLYGWMHGVARSARTGVGTVRQDASVRAWRAVAGGGRRSLRARALAAGFPPAVAALNRLGLGPLDADLSVAALRRSGLAAMAEVVRRLELRAAHVLFGHTHRAGPLAHDDEREWRAGSARLHNPGSWVREEVFIGPPGRRGAYWPGGVIVLEGDGPPRRVELLSERGRA